MKKFLARSLVVAGAAIAAAMSSPAFSATAEAEAPPPPPSLNGKQTGLGGGISVRSYGAKGDGVTDDRAAVQATIDAVAAAGGGTVYFPAGNYFINSIAQNPYGLLLKSKVSFTGDGPASVITAGSNIGNHQALFGNYVSAADNYEAQAVFAMATADKGDRQITLSTPAQAANFQGGHILYLRSGLFGAGGPNGEQNVVVSADANTGVIVLQYPLSKPYTNDGVNPYGVVDAEALTLRDISFSHLKIEAQSCVFGMQQCFNLAFMDMDITAVAPVARDMPIWSTGYLRNVIFRNLDLRLTSKQASGNGIMQIARNSIHLSWEKCHFWTDGCELLQFTEFCADIRVNRCTFTGEGGLAGARAYDVVLDSNYFDLSTPATSHPYCFYFGYGGADMDGLVMKGNTILYTGTASCISANGPNCIIADNNIVSNSDNRTAVATLQITGSGDGTLVMGNDVTCTFPTSPIGIVVSSASHRLAINNNNVLAAGNSGIGILFNDRGLQKTGPTVIGNTIAGFATGIDMNDLAHEANYRVLANVVISKAPYKPSSMAFGPLAVQGVDSTRGRTAEFGKSGAGLFNRFRQGQSGSQAASSRDSDLGTTPLLDRDDVNRPRTPGSWHFGGDIFMTHSPRSLRSIGSGLFQSGEERK